MRYPFRAFRQQVRGQRHVLRAARHHDLGVAALDGLRGQHHGFQPRTADFVDRRRPDRVRQPRTDARLAGHVLAQPCAEDVAEDHLVHLVARDARLLQRSFDRDTAQRHRG